MCLKGIGSIRSTWFLRFNTCQYYVNGLTLRSSRTQPARPAFLSLDTSFSSLFSFSAAGWAA